MALPKFLQGKLLGLPKPVVFGSGVAAIGIAVWYRKTHPKQAAGDPGDPGLTDEPPLPDTVGAGAGGGSLGSSGFPVTQESPPFGGPEQVFSWSPKARKLLTPFIRGLLSNQNLENAPPGTLGNLVYHYAMRLASTDARNRDVASFLKAYNQAQGTSFTLSQLTSFFPGATPTPPPAPKPKGPPIIVQGGHTTTGVAQIIASGGAIGKAPSKLPAVMPKAAPTGRPTVRPL